MLRKWISFFMSVSIMMLTAGAAAATGDLGCMQIMPTWQGQTVTGGEVSIVWVGTMESGIRVTDGLANWGLREEEILSEDWLPWIVENAEHQEISAATEFRGLQEGIYLVFQKSAADGFLKFKPFLQKIPEDGNWTVVKRPLVNPICEIPATGDHPAPIIGAMGIGFSVAVLMVLADSRKK